MLTMKVLYRDGVEWVADVAAAREVGYATFNVPDEERVETEPEDFPGQWERKRSDEIIGLFENRGPGTCGLWRGTVHVRRYDPGSVLKAVVVTFPNEREATYIVPIGDTYLLGPDGKTIDRI